MKTLWHLTLFAIVVAALIASFVRERNTLDELEAERATAAGYATALAACANGGGFTIDDLEVRCKAKVRK
jgi:4-hydroxybenzoate polyprenyltransferase